MRIAYIFIAGLLSILPGLADDTTQKTTILIPQEGQEWTYRVTMTTHLPTDIPSYPEGVLISQNTDSSGLGRISFWLTRKYEGKHKLKEHGLVDAFSVNLGDRKTKYEYVIIKNSIYATVGFQDLHPKVNEAVIFDKAISLFDEQYHGGESLKIEADNEKGEKITLVEIRAIGWVTLTTPSGKYDALHIRTIGVGYPHRVTRDLWFTPRVGLIKEKTTRFTKDKVFSTETQILEKITKKATGLKQSE